MSRPIPLGVVLLTAAAYVALLFTLAVFTVKVHKSQPDAEPAGSRAACEPSSPAAVAGRP